MFAASKHLLDHKLGRRAFIGTMTAGGMSLTGAKALAEALDSPVVSAPHQPARVVEGLTGGEALAEFLIEWDVNYVFGLAGSEEVGFLDALVDRKQINYCTCLHESAAMAMADGYSRATGRTPFVQLHSVAGAAYALGQLVNTWRDRVPAVIMTGRQSSDFRGQDGFLEAVNLHELPRDYAQWIWDVMDPASIPEVMRRAFLLAEAPPGGPAFVTISKDFLEKPLPPTAIVPRSRSKVEYDVVPPDEHVARIADALTAAQMPTLFVGNEAIRWDASVEIAAIAEHVGAGVMTAPKVPLVFPTTHPAYLGELGDDPAIAARIDCFWSLGGHMFKHGARPKTPPIPPGAVTIHTGLNEGEVGRNFPVDIAAVAGMRATASAVLEELRRRGKPGSAMIARREAIANASAKRRKELDAAADREAGNRPIATSRLMRELNAVMADDAAIVSEVVSSDQYLRYYLDIDHRKPTAMRRRNFDTTGGVLGWGVAAAIGVKIGNPQHETWCLTADGALNFGAQALWTAARYEVPIGIVVFNNGQYQSNRRFLHWYGRRAAETGQYPGVNLGHPDIDHVALAKAYGVEGESVDDPALLAAALKRAARAIRSEGRAYLVDVRIEKRYGGAHSDWFDFFSVAKGKGRDS